MAKTADDVARDLMGEKLDGYLVGRGEEPKAKDEEAKSVREDGADKAPGYGQFRTRRLTAKPGPKPEPRPPVDRKTWLKLQPALATPHLLSRQRADEKLVELRQRVRLEEDLAVIARADFEAVVREAVALALDYLEGAGLVATGGEASEKLRQKLGAVALLNMKHLGGDDRYRWLKVE
jgi:hypothetical protein